eukprot:TRINITY_DN1577_c0_g2_i2.p1 TRINITY_DN1577_c0_g2~~TRINITY_DN1577_c0_g2_i2.p1  ORF type:complete len:262 (-),score=35.35 TRINITY_DN1577_c0_g2_i2:153-938(-)
MVFHFSEAEIFFGFFRVLRAFRSLRSVSALKGFQMVFRTIRRSIPDMANILTLLLIVMFIFVIVAVDTFGAALPQHFGTISNCMFSLFVLMTQDGWVDIYKRYCEKQVSILWGSIYFMVFIIIGALVFVNIIVGVTVTNLLIANKEKKAVKKSKSRQLREQGKGAFSTSLSNVELEVVSVRGERSALWENQTPVKVPDLSNISLTQLQKYYLILIELEENMAERITLTKTLEEVIVSLSPGDEKIEVPLETKDLSGDILTK